jgi:hypothetical protein
MAGINGVSLPETLATRLTPLLDKIPQLKVIFSGLFPASQTAGGVRGVCTIAIGLSMVWLFPNVRQMLVKYKPTWEDMVGVKPPAPVPQGRFSGWLTWQPTPAYAWAVGALFVFCIFGLTRVSEFLYFRF